MPKISITMTAQTERRVREYARRQHISFDTAVGRILRQQIRKLKKTLAAGKVPRWLHYGRGRLAADAALAVIKQKRKRKSP